MIVITASNIPPRLRGKLSVWCTRINDNTFVSLLPTDARRILWQAIQQHAEGGDVTLAFEEGGRLHVFQQGEQRRVVIDRHGIPLSHWLP